MVTEPVHESTEIHLSRFNSVIGCRICHEAEETEKLITPCECSGTLGLIHTSCLEKWLSTSNSSECEICRCTFFVKRKSLPVWKYLCSSTICQSKHMIFDGMFLMFLTFMCGACIYYSNSRFKGSSKLSDHIEIFVLNVLLVLSYLVWLVTLIRYHYTAWKLWSSAHQVIKLVQDHEGNNVSLQSTSKNAV